MNGLPYYKAYPRDFIEGTIGMGIELKCVYRVILDLIYLQGGKLPDNAHYISGILECNAWKWTSLRKKLLATGKIWVDGDFLVNSRAFLELNQLEKFQRKQSEIRSRPNKIKDLQSPRSHQPDTDTDTDKKEGASHPTRASKTAFDEWWEIYPHKMQKAVGKKAFEKAIKRASLAELKAGVERYIRDKPPELNWRYPATWLNGDGWLDQPAPPTGNSTMDQLNQMGREYVSGQEAGNGDWSDVGRVFSREDPRLEGKGFPFLIDHKNGKH